LQRFWTAIVEPVLRARGARRIVEIGSQSGESTRRILEHCAQTGAQLTVIDPLDPANLEQIRTLLEAHGTHLKGLSLEVLPGVEPADAYLIDGDHNWWTVFHELELVHAATHEASDPGPVIVLHDVGWPYGRRDLYYDPATIPEAGRHPIVKGGLRIGQSEVRPDDGLNPHLEHADHEGGPKNGVLTAVEDFLAAHPGTYRLWRMPTYHGLAFVLRASAADTEAARLVDAFCNPASVHLELFERLERERNEVAIELGELRRARLQDARVHREALAARERELRAVRTRLQEIEATRGHKALEHVRNLRRALRKRRKGPR